MLFVPFYAKTPKPLLPPSFFLVLVGLGFKSFLLWGFRFDIFLLGVLFVVFSLQLRWWDSLWVFFFAYFISFKSSVFPNSLLLFLLLYTLSWLSFNLLSLFIPSLTFPHPQPYYSGMLPHTNFIFCNVHATTLTKRCISKNRQCSPYNNIRKCRVL